MATAYYFDSNRARLRFQIEAV